jgi:hypothetical protein
MGDGLEFMSGVLWLCGTAAVAAWASRRARSGVGWLLVSLLLSPLVAGIFLWSSRDRSRRPCVSCAEEIRMEAKICPFCRDTVVRERLAS